MAIKETFKKLCENLGKTNKPTYAVMAIATVKGIARPIFTMMDKDEDPETKKYTAIREGLTEVVAIPTYWACGEMTSKLAGKMKLTPDKMAAAEHNLMFLGVCTAALLVIPAVTSLVIKPLMKKLKSRGEKKEALEKNKLDIIDKGTEIATVKPNVNKIQKNNKLQLNYMPTKLADMKVGGLW
ncbi:MAG: hypothetical protein E7Z92_06320 [Cyanobacteria bacterium SIG31]|nr:hypothetical protein [Cyanobacteria bacterium SIG31]